MAADSFHVLGVRVDVVQIPDVVEILDRWIQERSACRYVAVIAMHSLSAARKDPGFRSILNNAGLVIADGMPIVWLARLHGKTMKRRACGPEMMEACCRQSAEKGHRHFLFGGAPGVAERLADSLRVQFPGLNIVGMYAPPFRPLTPAEIADIQQTIQKAAPDILWVGLSTPKQERWMHQFQNLLDVPVMVGVGAAFDMHSGMVRRAPGWMQEHGFEWLFRLIQEPRRLWRRYLLQGPQFLFYVMLELLGLKSFNSAVANKQ